MNEQEIASLLGDEPARPDPGFRLDVFKRIAGRARRRAMIWRGVQQIAVFLALGVVVGALQASGAAPTSDGFAAAGLALVSAIAAVALAGTGAFRSRLGLTGRL